MYAPCTTPCYRTTLIPRPDPGRIDTAVSALSEYLVGLIGWEGRRGEGELGALCVALSGTYSAPLP